MDWLVNTPFRVNERGFLLRVGEVLKVFIPIRIKCYDKTQFMRNDLIR